MRLLALDIGSSSIKAQLFHNGLARGRLLRTAYPTQHHGVKVEVDPDVLLRALAKAVSDLGAGAKKVDAIGLSVMAPAWVAMDKRGRAVTPIVTHQDRRSLDFGREIEARVGRRRHLKIAGNRPFPGSISSTTLAWFLKHEPKRMAKADLIGHLNTFVHRNLTGNRVIDPSNASFTGLYRTCDMGGWSEELCDAIGVSPSQLPEVVESNIIAGQVTIAAAAQFGLRTGTSVMAGMVDTGAAMMLTGGNVGQLFHMCGSTDVLAVVAGKARPNERLLTRALGVGKKWLSVATLAAVGSAIDWVRKQFFDDLSDPQFYKLIRTISRKRQTSTVRFEPYLAGERASMEQRQAAFSGLTLATTREDMLAAVVESLCIASAARLKLLASAQPTFLKQVYCSGGGGDLADMMHRDWPGAWKFRFVSEASLQGLAAMKV